MSNVKIVELQSFYTLKGSQGPGMLYSIDKRRVRGSKYSYTCKNIEALSCPNDKPLLYMPSLHKKTTSLLVRMEHEESDIRIAATLPFFIVRDDVDKQTSCCSDTSYVVLNIR
jgi:hypothetical protein